MGALYLNAVRLGTPFHMVAALTLGGFHH